MKFTAIAPDGSKITFASKTRTYTHAVLVFCEPAPERASAYWKKKPTGWQLHARCGRLDLAQTQVDAARRNDWLTRPCIGRDENGEINDRFDYITDIAIVEVAGK